jgi:hypothetical protein
MKKILIPILLLAGCSNTNRTETFDSKMLLKSTKFEGFDVHELRIDYCDYILVRRFEGVSIIHKGNCTNDFHKITK